MKGVFTSPVAMKYAIGNTPATAASLSRRKNSHAVPISPRSSSGGPIAQAIRLVNQYGIGWRMSANCAAQIGLVTPVSGSVTHCLMALVNFEKYRHASGSRARNSAAPATMGISPSAAHRTHAATGLMVLGRDGVNTYASPTAPSTNAPAYFDRIAAPNARPAASSRAAVARSAMRRA